MAVPVAVVLSVAVAVAVAVPGDVAQTVATQKRCRLAYVERPLPQIMLKNPTRNHHFWKPSGLDRRRRVKQKMRFVRVKRE